jgi:acyl-CoA synthetase (AMP-forming)/AMP-acid ligase II
MKDPAAGESPVGKNVINTTYTGAELVEETRAAAAKWGLDAQSRVLVDMPFTTLDGLLAGLMAPIHAGGSVIICRNLDKETLNQRVSVEHVTAVAGVTGWDQPSMSLHQLP